MPQVVLLQYKTLLLTKLVNTLIRSDSKIEYYYKKLEAQILLYSDNQRIFFLCSTLHGGRVCVAVLLLQLPHASPRVQRADVLQCQLLSNSMLQKVGVIKRFH